MTIGKVLQESDIFSEYRLSGVCVGGGDMYATEIEDWNYNQMIGKHFGGVCEICESLWVIEVL